MIWDVSQVMANLEVVVFMGSKPHYFSFVLLVLIAFSAISTSYAAKMTVNYNYDNLNRLTQSFYDSGDKLDYQYDAAGNITTVSNSWVLIDTDNDGMLDSWETANGLTVGINDSALDADNDTFTNLQEYQANTDPQDPNSHSVVSGFTVTTTAGTGGNISPASRTVTSGNTTTFTITPSTDYNINFVSGCGGTLSGTTFTTGGINADCTVTADFSYKYTSTGWGHSCFKDNSGKVKCWGR